MHSETIGSFFRSAVRIAPLLSAFICFCARAEVSVSPVALYLGDASRNGRISITNKGDRPRAIQVDILFGYPTSDARGNVLFRFVDSADSNEPFAAGWITAFPKQFNLGPGESQVVVFMADPPRALTDGEYWARPVITSRLGSAQRAYAGEVDVAHKIVISINYRHGSVITGLGIENISAQVTGEKLCLFVDLKREGNAAYLGNIVCRLNDDAGQTLGVIRREVAVYHSMRHRLEFGLGKSEGSYVAQLESNTNRQGNAPGDIIQSGPLFRSVVLSVVMGKGAKVVSIKGS